MPAIYGLNAAQCSAMKRQTVNADGLFRCFFSGGAKYPVASDAKVAAMVEQVE